MQAFRDTLDVCGFVDLGFTGPESTWYGNRHGHTIWERLDRGVTTHDWLEKYPTASIWHLHCVELDHRPILLVLDPNGESHRWKWKPFRFKEMWSAGRGCCDTVLRAWESWPRGHPMFKVTFKLKKCKKMLSAWSKDHFGNVKKQIAQKKELLWKAKEASTKGRSHEVVVHLRRELNVLLDKENHMWSQRSHVQWLTNGDRNTSYFHGVAAQRKHKNFIKGI